MEGEIKPSDFVTLVDIPNKGRGFIAARDIKVGEILFIEEPLKSPIYQSQNGVPPKETSDELAKLTKAHPHYEKFYYDTTKLTEKDDLARARGILRGNAFKSRLPDGSWIEMFFPFCSFFNHSCAPTATMYRTSKNTIRVYAIEDIKANEEICITYSGDILCLPTSLRQQALKRGWNFDCNCSRCKTPKETDKFLTQTTRGLEKEEIEDLMKNYEQIIMEAATLAEADKNWLRKVEGFLKLPLHNSHWRKLKIRQVLINLYSTHPDKYEKAKEHLEAFIKAAEVVLPKYHNWKVLFFSTYKQICEKLKYKPETVEQTLRNLDSAYDKVNELYVLSDK